jgi:hypothetical protein
VIASTHHAGRRRARLRASLLLEIAVSPAPAGALMARAAGRASRGQAMSALRSLERDGLVMGGSRYCLSHSGESQLRRFGELLDQALRGDAPLSARHE